MISRMFVVVVMWLVTMSSLCVAQQYTVTDLGTLGGDSSTALAVNRDGQVVGESYLRGNQQFHAFIWTSNRGMHDLGTLNSIGDSEAVGINDSGQVVGSSQFSTSNSFHAYIWSSQQGMTDLGTLGGNTSAGNGINGMGQVAGAACLADNVTQHAFFWNPTLGMQDLGTLGGSSSFAYGINDDGEVIGASYLSDNITVHPFIWTQSNGMLDLSLPGSHTSAFAVNGIGEIVGSAGTAHYQYAFINASNGSFRALGTLGGNGSVATGINALDQVVGYSITTSGPQNAFIWRSSSGIENLNDSIPPNSGVTLVEANGINRSGQIAAFGTTSSFPAGLAYLLTPIKQPSSQRSKP